MSLRKSVCILAENIMMNKRVTNVSLVLFFLVVVKMRKFISADLYFSSFSH